MHRHANKIVQESIKLKIYLSIPMITSLSLKDNAIIRVWNSFVLSLWKYVYVYINVCACRNNFRLIQPHYLDFMHTAFVGHALETVCICRFLSQMDVMIDGYI